MTSADIVHEFQAYSHLGEKGGGGTLIFSNIRRPGPFLGLAFWYFVMTPKDIHKIFIPQKIFIFLKTLKGIEIQNFEPQNGASLRMNENIIVPPPPSTLSSQIETGAGGVQTQITEKKPLKRVFIVGFFATILYFFKSNQIKSNQFYWYKVQSQDCHQSHVYSYTRTITDVIQVQILSSMRL